MVVEMSIPAVESKIKSVDEIKRLKMDTYVDIPANENVLIYTQDLYTGLERTLDEALDFMVNMSIRAKRKIISHCIIYELKALPRSSPSKYYTITMILEPYGK